MFYTAVRYRWTDETSARLTNNDDLIDKTRLMGMFDDNVDGRIQKAELKGEMGANLVKFFPMVDKNADGAIDKVEYAAMQAMMGGRRREQAQQAPKPTPAPAPAAVSGGGR
jgi:Ca2+-binding EF-hand superfamily protein